MEDEFGRLTDALKKEYGIGSIRRLSELPPDAGITGWTPLGISVIERELIGWSGIPDGRIVLVCGGEGSSKTTLAQHILLGAQKRGGIAVLEDTEHALDPIRAKNIGLDPNKIIYSQPDTVEDVFDHILSICEGVSGKQPTCIVWDSFSASPTRGELYGSGDAAKRNLKSGILTQTEAQQGQIAGHAKIASTQLRRVTAAIDKKNISLVIVVQSKEQIDFTGWGTGGPTFLAEAALKFHSTLFFECKRGELLKQGETPIGIKVKITCRKNKLAGTFMKTVSVDNLFASGFNEASNKFDKALELGLIKPESQGWFSCDGKKAKFTKTQFESVLLEVPAIAKALEGK